MKYSHESWRSAAALFYSAVEKGSALDSRYIHWWETRCFSNANGHSTFDLNGEPTRIHEEWYSYIIMEILHHVGLYYRPKDCSSLSILNRTTSFQRIEDTVSLRYWRHWYLLQFKSQLRSRQYYYIILRLQCKVIKCSKLLDKITMYVHTL